MNIKELINTALDSERYSPEYKSAWRQLFQHATQIAKSVPNRDLDPATIVDNWLADHQLYLNHCDPNDDLVAGDMSCMQAMRKQQQSFIAEIREQYVTALRNADNRDFSIKRRREFLNIAKRLRKLYREENATNITSVPFEVYEEFGDSAEFDEPITDTQAYINRLEYRESINQEPECDPDDSHYVGDTFRYNRGKPRGNIGLLNGLYQQTDPEPTYRTAEGRRCMLRQLRLSHNEDDIRMFFNLTQPTRRNETDEQWAIKRNRRENALKQAIINAQYKENKHYEQTAIRA
jgi:hypothetical protein